MNAHDLQYKKNKIITLRNVGFVASMDDAILSFHDLPASISDFLEKYKNCAFKFTTVEAVNKYSNRIYSKLCIKGRRIPDGDETVIYIDAGLVLSFLRNPNIKKINREHETKTVKTNKTVNKRLTLTKINDYDYATITLDRTEIDNTTGAIVYEDSVGLLLAPESYSRLWLLCEQILLTQLGVYEEYDLYHANFNPNIDIDEIISEKIRRGR